MGSPAFLDRFASDPFIAPSEPVVWRTVSGTPVAEFPVPFYVSGLRVSAGGTLVALEPMTHTATADIRSFQAGRAGAPLSPLTATDLVFTDEEHALLMDSLEGRIELRLVSLKGEPSEVWRRTLTDIFDAALSFQRTSRRWRIVGRDASGRIVRAEGPPGGDRIEFTRWPAPDTSHGWLETIATSGAAALAIESRPEPRRLQPAGLGPWALLLRPSGIQSHVWTIGQTTHTNAAFSRLAVNCSDGALGSHDERLVCAAFDGSRTRFVALDPADGEVTPIAWLRGAFVQQGTSGPGWLTGWADGSLIALRLDTRDALRFRAEIVTEAGGTDQFLATASYRSPNGSMIRIYSAGDLVAPR